MNNDPINNCEVTQHCVLTGISLVISDDERASSCTYASSREKWPWPLPIFLIRLFVLGFCLLAPLNHRSFCYILDSNFLSDILLVNILSQSLDHFFFHFAPCLPSLKLLNLILSCLFLLFFVCAFGVKSKQLLPRPMFMNAFPLYFLLRLL